MLTAKHAKVSEFQTPFFMCHANLVVWVSSQLAKQ